MLGFFGLFFAMILLGYLHYQAAMRSFGLITHVPDRVTRWFGQGGEQLGEEEHSTKIAAAGVAMIERNTGNIAQAVQAPSRAPGGANNQMLTSQIPGKMLLPRKPKLRRPILHLLFQAAVKYKHRSGAERGSHAMNKQRGG